MDRGWALRAVLRGRFEDRPRRQGAGCSDPRQEPDQRPGARGWSGLFHRHRDTDALADPDERGDIGDLEPWLDFTGTALQYDEGANLNGIAALPDGQSLIVVQMGKGLLFRIDLKTKKVSPIDTAGADLTGADGLVLDGHTLYVVRQTAVEIATVSLSPTSPKERSSTGSRIRCSRGRQPPSRSATGCWS